MRRPKIGLALGGGGAYGLAHVGVIKVLEKEEIPISMLAGTSAGAIIGSLYASGLKASQLEEITKKIKFRDLMHISIANNGFFNAIPLSRFVESTTGKSDISEMKIPFYVVATDLQSGSKVVLEKGPLGKVVLASSSIPGIFPPIHYEGMILADGGIVENVPARTLQEKGADIVVGVNVLGCVQKTQKLDTIPDLIIQTLHLFLIQGSKSIAESADIMICPKITDAEPYNFKKAKVLIEAGEQAAVAAMPQLKEILEEYKKREPWPR